MKPDVFIRADGSSTIGLGHLVRCSALAHMLKGDFQITFYCIDIPDALAEEFEAAGFGLKKIENERGFFQELKPNQIAVLDGYGFDTDYQRNVKEAGCKLVCIDDLHDREFLANLIINHAPGITPQDYNAQTYTRFALGPEYALLRPAFLEQAKKKRKVKKTEALLIAFGGSDPQNLTERTLKAAIQFQIFKKITVITGSAYQANDSFKALILTDRRVKHIKALAEKEMLAAMLEADLAIVPASGIMLEALASNLKIVTGTYTNNQKKFLKGFSGLSNVFNSYDFSSSSLILAMEDALNNETTEHSIIDGKSQGRILDVFLSLASDS